MNESISILPVSSLSIKSKRIRALSMGIPRFSNLSDSKNSSLLSIPFPFRSNTAFSYFLL